MSYRTNKGRFELTERWECNYIVAGGAENLIIAKGYTTNGASIPWFFTLLLKRFDPRWLEECTIHDYLCDKGQYMRADAWFEQLLIDNDEITMWRRKVFIASVKNWHSIAYKDALYFEQAHPKWWLKIVQRIKTVLRIKKILAKKNRGLRE